MLQIIYGPHTGPGHVACDSDAGKNLPHHDKEQHQDNTCQYRSLSWEHKDNIPFSSLSFSSPSMGLLLC